MASSLDMSLDDIINQNKTKRSTAGGVRGGRPRGSGGPGPARRIPNRSGNRPGPYSTAKVPDSAWQHDMYSDRAADALYVAPGAARATAIETGTKLYISNLDYGVSNEDIKELFTEVGDLKRFSIHYDRSGRSKGTAEVVFSRRSDALAAVKRYNNVQLDGKPMKIEVVGRNISAPAAPMITNGGPIVHNGGPIVHNGGFGSSDGFPKSGPARGGFTGWPRGGRGRGGRGRGRGRGRGEPKSATDLDAELEKYHQEAMQTN